MTILNLMLGRGRGGIEQAAIDYAESLSAANMAAVTILSPGAWAELALTTAGLAHEPLRNWNAWDPFAAHQLRSRARALGARAVICHGNRALTLALRALKGKLPIIAVAHNYSNKRFAQADACFAITQDLATHLANLGAKNIHAMPNMARLPAHAPCGPMHTPPVIGTMGRFIPRKGFRTFVDACAILQQRGIAFRAILGGNGEEADSLTRLIQGYGLESTITLPGWISNKTAFFESIDLFVLPSSHEAFGIVLIEAMSHAVPVISAAAEGPKEVIQHGENGLLVPCNDAPALAAAIEQLLIDHTRAHTLGEAGRATVATHYSQEAMAARLQNALAPYISRA